MRSFASALCLLASTISPAHTSAEGRLIGTWKYDANSVQIILNDQGRKDLAHAGPNGPKQLEAMKAGFGKMMAYATLKFKPGHVFELSMENPKTHEKKIVPGKWIFKSGHVLVTPDARSPAIDFLPNKDMSRLVNVFKRPSFGEGRITAVKSK